MDSQSREIDAAPLSLAFGKSLDKDPFKKKDRTPFSFDRSAIKTRLWLRQSSIRLFLTCFLVFGLHFATNTVREIYPALSLADHLSFDVSEYKGLHPDIFEIAGRGSFINNNPGASIMGSVPYFLLKPVVDRIVARTQASRSASGDSPGIEYKSEYPMAQEFYKNARERGLDIKFGLAAAIMQMLLMAPFSALATVVMFWLLTAITKNRRISILLALLYAFATPVLYRTAQLNQNLLLAHFALFSFALLWRPSATGTDQKRPLYFLAGLCAGWTVVLDYSGLVAVTALAGYAVSRWYSATEGERDFKHLVRFAAGIIICAVVLMAYQWSSFGNPFLPAQTYMPAANFTNIGYRGFSFPQLDLLFDTAFSIRYGLFTSAPILMLAFYVPAWLREQSRILGSKEITFIVEYLVLFFLFCAANQYGRMQFNSGVRHIVPAVPFIFLLAANTLIRMPKFVGVAFGLFATYWSWCLAMYRDVELGDGILESVKHITLEGFRLPWLTTLERMGYVQSNAVLPIFFFCIVIIWIFWNVGGNPRIVEA